jgi:hypothetical protein
LVKDALGRGFLPLLHQAVDEAAHQRIVIFQVRQNGPFDYSAFSWHFKNLGFRFSVFGFRLGKLSANHLCSISLRFSFPVPAIIFL